MFSLSCVPLWLDMFVTLHWHFLFIPWNISKWIIKNRFFLWFIWKPIVCFTCHHTILEYSQQVWKVMDFIRNIRTGQKGAVSLYSNVSRANHSSNSNSNNTEKNERKKWHYEQHGILKFRKIGKERAGQNTWNEWMNEWMI